MSFICVIFPKIMNVTDIQLCYNQGPTSFREAIEGSEKHVHVRLK